ncbi:MAG TPA: formate--tetrahydrofolate ligase [Candidatus Paceibacterota bacterium]|nr:formate--tetrahydrofolate ligase [Verrucomicrobiota bacterium]HRY51157.1 formate--tetrahydrofolate ligase [Candidatus Paceibacterota bacterium]HSA01593.1 formate--tetrahydrofolate ligase [Candidatus Paceibacterota bacterium]
MILPAEAEVRPPRRIQEVARELGLDTDKILPHGHYIAKIPIGELNARAQRKNGQLILVSAMTPTPQGEGKTTTTIGLGDALRRLGHRTMICLREPSLGPYFGIKGGGTGAGKSKVMPDEDINLHFVGDMYAVTKANNLLAAMVDNHLQHGNELGIDARRIVLRRVIDLNDRALRDIIIGLGGVKHGVPRRDGFNITPASEVMAILCLARDYADLGERLNRMVVAFKYKGEPVRAAEIKAVGAMQVLLRDAIHPNLVQTLEGTPALVHGGPFANIAQGTNTAVATRLALKLADYVVTEAGFATDLGAEKFFHIKCRLAGLNPGAVVIVATAKAVAYHGGFGKQGGLGNLAKHIENVRLFGLEPVVALNHFQDDRSEDLDKIVKFCEGLDVEAVVADHYREGGQGAIGLGEAVLRCLGKRKQRALRFLYPLNLPLDKKIERLASKVYGADGVDFDRTAETDLELLDRHGFGQLPVCVAKTPLSLSDDPSLRGRPRGFRLTVNELRVSAGAGFVVAICGNIVTMPGLPKVPAAARIEVLADGRAVGLT